MKKLARKLGRLCDVEIEQCKRLDAELINRAVVLWDDKRVEVTIKNGTPALTKQVRKALRAVVHEEGQ
jgi:hypothetical protein